MKFNICGLLILFCSFSSLPQGKTFPPPSVGDSFDSYRSNIRWTEEIFHLDNFAVFLKRNPQTVGYIGYYSGANFSSNRQKLRIVRAKKYLIRKGIAKSRIIIIYAGKLDKARTVLQPVDKDLPPPDFS